MQNYQLATLTRPDRHMVPTDPRGQTNKRGGPVREGRILSLPKNRVTA